MLACLVFAGTCGSFDQFLFLLWARGEEKWQKHQQFWHCFFLLSPPPSSFMSFTLWYKFILIVLRFLDAVIVLHNKWEEGEFCSPTWGLAILIILCFYRYLSAKMVLLGTVTRPPAAMTSSRHPAIVSVVPPSSVFPLRYCSCYWPWHLLG